MLVGAHETPTPSVWYAPHRMQWDNCKMKSIPRESCILYMECNSLNQEDKMDDGSLEQIRSKTKATIQSWSETCGLAPEGVTDKFDAAMLNWMNDLTDSLDIWIAKSLDMTDGELILAWTNLGALVECWLRFFYCAYYEDYMKSPKLGKKGKPLEPDDKAMTFDYLIQYSKGILWDSLQDPLYLWVYQIQHYRNAIHAFSYREIGHPSDFILNIGQYSLFVDEVIDRLPPIEDYRQDLLSDCY